MQVGTPQSQSYVAQSKSFYAELNVTTEIRAQKVATQEGGPPDAVLLSVSRTVDFSYAQQVLKTEVGTQLESALKDAGVEQDLESLVSGAVDQSPEATAKRIVDFATSFLDAFQVNNPDTAARQQIQDFSALIRGAVDEGFSQSRDLLEGIAKLTQGVQDDIDKTYGLVMQGIDTFSQDQLQVISAAEPQPPVDDSAPDLLAV